MSSRITGAHTSWAATGRASAVASGRPSAPAQRSASGPPRSTRAPVASTESTKPTSPASHGSATSSTTTVAPSAAGARCGRPSRTPSRATSPIAAARSTLGDGCTTSTIAAIAATVRPARAGRGRRTADVRASTRAATSEKCAPDTAVTCVRPAVRRAPASPSEIAAVSPTVTPANNAPASPGSVAASDRTPSRNRDAAASGADGADTTSGAPPLSRTATVRLPASPGRSRPAAATRAPEGTAAHDDGPSTSTWPVAPDSRPRAATRSTATRPGHARARRATPAGGRSGRRRRLPSTRATAPSRASAGRRPSSRAAVWLAPAPSTAAATTRQRATTGPTAARDGRPPHTGPPVAAPARTCRPAASVDGSPPGRRCRRARQTTAPIRAARDGARTTRRAASHATAAAGSSRTSTVIGGSTSSAGPAGRARPPGPGCGSGRTEGTRTWRTGRVARRHTRTRSRRRSSRVGPMPATSASSSTVVNGSVLAVRHDPVRQHRTDAGQRVERRGVRRVEVHEVVPAGRRRGTCCCRCLPGPGHRDLLAVDQDPREVEGADLRVRGHTTGRGDGVDHPRPLREPDHAGCGDGAHHVHHDAGCRGRGRGAAATGPLGAGVGRTTAGPGATAAARSATAPATSRTTAPAAAASRHEIAHRTRRRGTGARVVGSPWAAV